MKYNQHRYIISKQLTLMHLIGCYKLKMRIVQFNCGKLGGKCHSIQSPYLARKQLSIGLGICIFPRLCVSVHKCLPQKKQSFVHTYSYLEVSDITIEFLE